jgi:hypothetical protein
MRRLPNDLGRALVVFFDEYLPAQRGLSPHTVRSYRDAIVLYFVSMSMMSPSSE